MSFFIDDILKQKPKTETINNPSDIINKKQSQNPKQISILEYTLLKKNLFDSVPDNFNNKFSVYYEQLCTNFVDPYLTKTHSLRNMYIRDPRWTNLVPYPTMYNCPYYYMRRKGGQIRFTASQTEELEKQFSTHKYLSPEDRKQLAELLQLSDRQVKTWFQNRRAKWRRNNQVTINKDNIDVTSFPINRISD